MILPYPHDPALVAGRLIYSGAPISWRDREFLHEARGAACLDAIAVWRIASIAARHGKGVGQ